VGPVAEICNGRDDDCDGQSDENPANGNACGTCGPPPLELCDGVDNDCDGSTDEGVSNACGQCGDLADEVCNEIDDDCDGLTDEGVVNYCGRCGQSCFTIEFDEANEWDLGSAINLSPPEDNPNALALGSGQARGDAYLYVAANSNNQVIKIDTRSCEIVDRFPSYGNSPSRTAVMADGTVWVGNRSFMSGGLPENGGAVHMDADGQVICRAEVPYSSTAVRAVTIDQAGNAWIGSWDQRYMYSFSAYEIEDGWGADGIPRCRMLQRVNVGMNPYGAAVDSRGFLWTSGIGPDPTKVDTRDGTIVGRVSRRARITEEDGTENFLGMTLYGLAIDRHDNVWYGVIGPAGFIARIDGETHEMTAYRHPGGRTRGIAVDFDGNIWGADDTRGMLHKYAPDGTRLLSCSTFNNHGVAVDADGQIWGVAGGQARRYTTDCQETCRVGGLPSLYTYSDMTGMQLLTITLRSGRWSVRLDGGTNDVQWDSVDWAGVFPNGTNVDARVRTARTLQTLVGAPWSNRIFESPMQVPVANPETGYTPRNRWIEVELRLSRQEDEVMPSLERVRVHYQRP
jgi:streptogramin lyase